ncbi:MAG: flotillin family protein, partial [Bacteroidales bacterium]|nr:flotillin family protein [Bacteroidales bacterium]
MGDAVFTLVFIAFVVSLILIVWFVKRYKRCPSDKILVVYGKVGKGSAGTRTAKCIHGGAAFIWPVIQDYEFLDLSPLTISVDLKKALSKQQIRVNVPCNFMVGISTEDGVMNNAAERLLGIRLDDIRILAEDIIIGQLRVVIATMTIEEINSNREMFLRNVSDSVEQELKKLGLKLINVNVKDITDESGYIDALGKKEAERAINKAKIEVAEEQKNGAIGEAKFRKEQSIEVAAQTAEAQI